MSAVYSHLYANFARNLKKQYRLTYKSHEPLPDGETHAYAVSCGGQTVTGNFSANAAPSVVVDAASLDLSGQSQVAAHPITLSGSVEDTNARLLNQELSGTLYYRTIGDNAYHQTAMTVSQTGLVRYTWQVTIPADAVTPSGVEYYFSITDGISTTYFPASYAILPQVIPVLENRPPDIDHSPVVDGTSYLPIAIRAVIDDMDQGQTIQSVYLYYRPRDPYNQIEFIRLPMAQSGGHTYTAEIPADHVFAEGVDYFIAAWDSLGTRRDHGMAIAPHAIAIDGITNAFPLAAAGEDQFVSEAGTVMLDASQSSDPDLSDTVSYTWEQISGPAVVLMDPNAIQTSFIAPLVSGGTVTLGFLLRIGDTNCQQATDTVEVAIADTAPVAQFSWTPQRSRAGTAVSFSDQSSFSVDEITEWHWEFGDLGESSDASPLFTFNNRGLYDVRLTVSDADGSTATLIQSLQVTGLPPVANAGPDQLVSGEDIVTMDGAGSYDPDVDDTLSYRWTQVEGPTVLLAGAETLWPEFSALPSEEDDILLVFELTVTDSEGLEDSDTVTITIAGVPCIDCGSNSGCFISAAKGTSDGRPTAANPRGDLWLLLGAGLIFGFLRRYIWGDRQAGPKCLMVALFGGLLFMGTPSEGTAEIRPGHVSMTPFVGGYMFDAEQNIDLGYVYGIGLQYHITPHWGVELLGSAGHATHPFIDWTQNLCIDEDVDGQWVSVNGVYHLWPERKFEPYLTMGGDHLNLDYELTDRYCSSFFLYGGDSITLWERPFRFGAMSGIFSALTKGIIIWLSGPALHSNLAGVRKKRCLRLSVSPCHRLLPR